MGKNSMPLKKYLMFALLLGFVAWSAADAGDQKAEPPFDVVPLQGSEITADTGEKPQSKLWLHDGCWWAVFPNAAGTHLWRLDDTRWSSMLHLSDSTDTHADAKRAGGLAHVLLLGNARCELVSLEYSPAAKTYHLWPKCPAPVSFTLDAGVETATIDVDSSGRMWLASDGESAINVRWSEPPYSSWSAPLALANGVGDDDICAVAAFPSGGAGVLWSNQNTRQFGFRFHPGDATPGTWSGDETPAAASGLPVGGGMADDHLNCAVASDGTLYAAVKTSYDTDGYVVIGLLVRRPSGVWDELYRVDDDGTRPIALLNEKNGSLLVAYRLGDAIVCKKSPLNPIAFGPRCTLMTKGAERLNNVTSTKDSFSDDVVILASTATTAEGVRVRPR